MAAVAAESRGEAVVVFSVPACYTCIVGAWRQCWHRRRNTRARPCVPCPATIVGAPVAEAGSTRTEAAVRRQGRRNLGSLPHEGCGIASNGELFCNGGWRWPWFAPFLCHPARSCAESGSGLRLFPTITTMRY